MSGSHIKQAAATVSKLCGNRFSAKEAAAALKFMWHPVFAIGILYFSFSCTVVVVMILLTSYDVYSYLEEATTSLSYVVVNELKHNLFQK